MELDDIEPQEIPIDGTLDLHTFQPRDLGELLPEYLRACRERNILEVRIVHGKGSGQLRQGVRAFLDRLPEVIQVQTGGLGAGSWGATLVTLRPLNRNEGDAG